MRELDWVRLGRPWGDCRVLAVHDFGTVDVEASNGKCFRVTGVQWVLVSETRIGTVVAERAWGPSR